jgi:hypothetical protein
LAPARIVAWIEIIEAGRADLDGEGHVLLPDQMKSTRGELCRFPDTACAKGRQGAVPPALV